MHACLVYSASGSAWLPLIVPAIAAREIEVVGPRSVEAPEVSSPPNRGEAERVRLCPIYLSHAWMVPFNFEAVPGEQANKIPYSLNVDATLLFPTSRTNIVSAVSQQSACFSRQLQEMWLREQGLACLPEMHNATARCF